MAGLDDILGMLPIDSIAKQLGVDPAVATQAITQGGATILGGLQRNAQSPEGAAAIQQALAKHTGQADAVDIDAVDTADGQKILGHIFGGEQTQVAQTLTDSPKTAGIDFGKLLPLLAPIVMGLIAKQSGSAQSSAPSDTKAGNGGGIGDIIGGLLGGGAGGGIGDLLGGLLGGGKSDDGAGKDSGGGLGGLLGGLFGGNR